jgi:hypothetical protein
MGKGVAETTPFALRPLCKQGCANPFDVLFVYIGSASCRVNVVAIRDNRRTDVVEYFKAACLLYCVSRSCNKCTSDSESKCAANKNDIPFHTVKFRIREFTYSITGFRLRLVFIAIKINCISSEKIAMMPKRRKIMLKIKCWLQFMCCKIPPQEHGI